MLFLSALVFAMSTAALSVTSPTEGSSISQSGNIEITWSTVSTDSQSFNIELALSTDAGNEQTLATNVSPSTSSYSTPASSYAAGNYTINLVGTTQTSSGILAQSKWFLITASTGSSSARGSAAGSTTAAAGAATTGTATTTSSHASGTAAGASGSASASGSARQSSAGTTTASTSGSENVVFSIGSFIAGAAALLL